MEVLLCYFCFCFFRIIKRIWKILGRFINVWIVEEVGIGRRRGYIERRCLYSGEMFLNDYSKILYLGIIFYFERVL